MNISGEISLFWTDYTSIYSAPRIINGVRYALNCRIVGEFGSEDDRGSFRAAVAKSVDDVVKDVGGEAASKAKAREGGGGSLPEIIPWAGATWVKRLPSK